MRRVDAASLPNVRVLELTDLLLSVDLAADAVNALLADVAPAWTAAGLAPDREAREDGIVLGIMGALDQAFLQIHPRTSLLPAAVAPRARLPIWLANMQEERTLTGEYGRDGSRRLVPRGPLSRPARSIIDTNADSLPDYFVALTAAPLHVHLDEHPVGIACAAVGPGGTRGVSASNLGREKVGFAPIAEVDSDLVFKRREANGQWFLDVDTRADLDAGQRLLQVIGRLGKLDVLIAPELTISEEEAMRYAAALDPETAPALTIAGSGHGGEIDEKGRRLNASTAFNAFGAALWTHCKVWPYGMAKQQVDDCKLGLLDDDALLMEDVRPGGAITIADLDGFGRVLTLICQDLQMPSVEEIVRVYQPDWVFVPILDKGVDTSRWPHVRAFELTANSRARFVIASSLSLAERAGAADFPDTSVALFVGPRSPSQMEQDAGIQSRAVAAVSCTESNPRCGRIQWGDRSAAWKKTSVGNS